MTTVAKAKRTTAIATGKGFASLATLKMIVLEVSTFPTT